MYKQLVLVCSSNWILINVLVMIHVGKVDGSILRSKFCVLLGKEALCSIPKSALLFVALAFMYSKYDRIDLMVAIGSFISKFCSSL